jgi:tetratricopeptide (TPR) repeat protein
MGLLADACIKNQRYAQALDCLNKAQSRLDDQGTERFYAAEIYRLLGETYLRSHQDLDQAERYFCKGLEVARTQNAKSLELRLCTNMYDLYELRQGSDKHISQLTEIYRFFDEGFDTADLLGATARLRNA